MKKITGVWALLVLVTLTTNATVKLPAIFSNGLVLQRETNVNVWGWADPAESFTLQCSWGITRKITAGKDGKWQVVIKTGKAGGTNSMTWRSASGSGAISDILFGEVFLCSGQSNMGFTMKTDADAKTEIPLANFPEIRYFSVKRQYGTGNFDDAPGSVWEKTSPETVSSFSAVAYYFAKKLQAQLHVPVGIVFSAWGGTPAEAWIPRQTVTTDTLLHRYVDRWTYIQQHVGMDSVRYHQQLDDWSVHRSGTDSAQYKKPGEPQTLYYYNRPWREPGVLFEGMIRPVVPYTVKGVVWYQGESNVGYADEYAYVLRSLVREWRSAWGGKASMPFYIIQIAAYGYSNLENAAIVRDAQYRIMQLEPGTYTVITLDLGNMDNIHYTHKQPAADRLLRAVLNRSYHQPVAWQSPAIVKMERQGNDVVLHFGQDIRIGRGEAIPGGFEVGSQGSAGGSTEFLPVQASLDGTRIIRLHTGDATKAVVVRYGWLLPGAANIVGADGLPLAPFSKKI